MGKDHTSKVTGNRQIDIAGNRGLTVHGADTVTVEGEETIKAKGKVAIESAQELLLRAPVVRIQGILTTEGYEGGPGSSTLYGDFTVRNGRVDVPGKDVTAGAVSYGRYARQLHHWHPGGWITVFADLALFTLPTLFNIR